MTDHFLEGSLRVECGSDWSNAAPGVRTGMSAVRTGVCVMVWPAALPPRNDNPRTKIRSLCSKVGGRGVLSG